MTDSAFLDGAIRTCVAAQATLRHIRFAPQAGAGQTVLLEFADPGSCLALATSTPITGPLPELPAPAQDGIDILTIPLPPAEHQALSEALSKWVGKSASGGTAAPIGTVLHGVQVFWCPDRAALAAAPDRLELVLKALVEFCHYENELRKLEREICAAWPELQADTPLAHEVTPTDLERCDEVGRRMASALQRRLRHARLQPHLQRASAQLTLQAQELGHRLREKSRVEDRHETLDGQLTAFERVYEMASQRISDYRANRVERKLEWIIIVLLAAEVLLLLAEVLSQLKK